MALTPEQLIATHKANLETLFGLTTKAFEGVEKIVELNVAASRAALTEAANHTQALLNVKDAQELLALQSSLFQPLAEKTAAYNRHLYNIATSTSTELSKTLEAKAGEFQQGFNNLVESTAKNAPAGSETPVSWIPSSPVFDRAFFYPCICASRPMSLHAPWVLVFRCHRSHN